MTKLAVLAAAAIVAAPTALAAPPRKGHHHHPRVVKRQLVDPCAPQVGALPAACLAARR